MGGGCEERIGKGEVRKTCGLFRNLVFFSGWWSKVAEKSHLTLGVSIERSIVIFIAVILSGVRVRQEWNERAKTKSWPAVVYFKWYFVSVTVGVLSFYFNWNSGCVMNWINLSAKRIGQRMRHKSDIGRTKVTWWWRWRLNPYLISFAPDFFYYPLHRPHKHKWISHIFW